MDKDILGFVLVIYSLLQSPKHDTKGQNSHKYMKTSGMAVSQ